MGVFTGLPQTHLVLWEERGTWTWMGTVAVSASFVMMMKKTMSSIITVIIIRAIPGLFLAQPPGQEATFPYPSPPHRHTHTPQEGSLSAPCRHTRHRSQGSLPGSEPLEPRAPGWIQTGFPALPSTSHCQQGQMF